MKYTFKSTLAHLSYRCQVTHKYSTSAEGMRLQTWWRHDLETPSLASDVFVVLSKNRQWNRWCFEAPWRSSETTVSSTISMCVWNEYCNSHYCDVIIGTATSQTTSPTITQPFIQTQIKENIKAPRHWPFVQGIRRGQVNSPHKCPVTRKVLRFDDVIML